MSVGKAEPQEEFNQGTYINGQKIIILLGEAKQKQKKNQSFLK